MLAGRFTTDGATVMVYSRLPTDIHLASRHAERDDVGAGWRRRLAIADAATDVAAHIAATFGKLVNVRQIIGPFLGHRAHRCGHARR